ncbi:hypothetical protein ACUW97_002148 [Kocuria rhizophila]
MEFVKDDRVAPRRRPRGKRNSAQITTAIPMSMIPCRDWPRTIRSSTAVTAGTRNRTLVTVTTSTRCTSQ